MIRYTGTAIFLLIVGIVGALVFYMNYRRPDSRLPRETMYVKGEAFTVEIADTPFARAEGLSGRSKLGENEGMLFVFPRPEVQRFWMKGMLIPIDIVWISEGRVVGFEENVEPEPDVPQGALTVYQSPRPVDRVFEVRAGTVQRLGLQVGDEIITP